MAKRLIGLILAVMLPFILPLPGAAQSGYTIRPGDVLQLEVLEDNTLNRSLLVLPDGTVTVPTVGSIKAAGRNVDALRAEVTQALAPSFANKPTVYLSVGTIAPRVTATPVTIDIYVMGEVAKAGAVSVPRGATILQALAIAGGPTNFAATRRIQLLRTDRAGQQHAYLFNYQALMSGTPVPTIVLTDGDVIVVPARRLFE